MLRKFKSVASVVLVLSLFLSSLPQITFASVVSSSKEFLSFSVEGTPGIIDNENHTISVVLPAGVTRNNQIATFTINGQSVSIGNTVQDSGHTVNDFTNSLTYTVTAEDGVTQNYVVTVITAINIPSPDGIGHSGSIPGNEVVDTTFTGYQSWPSGLTKGSSAYVGGVYDGTSIWMIPYNANELVKVNPSTGEMTGYSNWPAGFTKGSNAFAGGVYDGTNIWLIPYSANQIIKVNAATGEMTGYSSWPGGSKGSDQFIGGASDGTNIWLSPYSGSRLIKVDSTTGAMTSYNSWPSGTILGSYPFYGSVFDGTSIWLIPNNADRLIKVDPATGEMTGYNNWPSGFTKSADAFWEVSSTEQIYG